MLKQKIVSCPECVVKSHRRTELGARVQEKFSVTSAVTAATGFHKRLTKLILRTKA